MTAHVWNGQTYSDLDAERSDPGHRPWLTTRGWVVAVCQVATCDGCGNPGELTTCWHGVTRCDECGLCPDCSIEARRP